MASLTTTPTTNKQLDENPILDDDPATVDDASVSALDAPPAATASTSLRTRLILLLLSITLVLVAVKYSSEHKFRPAASPIITETLKDGRMRLRGAAPATKIAVLKATPKVVKRAKPTVLKGKKKKVVPRKQAKKPGSAPLTLDDFLFMYPMNSVPRPQRSLYYSEAQGHAARREHSPDRSSGQGYYAAGPPPNFSRVPSSSRPSPASSWSRPYGGGDAYPFSHGTGRAPGVYHPDNSTTFSASIPSHRRLGASTSFVNRGADASTGLAMSASPRQFSDLPARSTGTGTGTESTNAYSAHSHALHDKSAVLTIVIPPIAEPFRMNRRYSHDFSSVAAQYGYYTGNKPQVHDMTFGAIQFAERAYAPARTPSPLRVIKLEPAVQDDEGRIDLLADRDSSSASRSWAGTRTDPASHHSTRGPPPASTPAVSRICAACSLQKPPPQFRWSELTERLICSACAQYETRTGQHRPQKLSGRMPRRSAPRKTRRTERPEVGD
ncbi:hypothetical protein MKEN_00969400 [Mycena kentingensis (nom. inval.)]|nr:hypothetical protein MKEN_00969400 [Mycena kentingensis (nom. inval.)]